MKEYFALQYKMTNRKLTDFGIHPILGYALLLFVFIGFSLLLFSKTSFAPYIYTLSALYFATRLSEMDRNDFLKICFETKRYKAIRILENFIIVLPFAFFLLYKLQIYPAITLVILAAALALLNFKTTYNVTIPTPFSKKPFEFTVGFRNTFYLLLLAYCLAAIAIVVNNFNLGVFSMVFIFLIVFTYYLKPENEYYVWSYSLTPVRFLGMKIKTAFAFTSFLVLPVLLFLSIFYIELVSVLALFTLLGYLYLVTVILVKYSAYPEEINLPQAIIIGISLIFPPLLIGILPYFAGQSAKNLKTILK